MSPQIVEKMDDQLREEMRRMIREEAALLVRQPVSVKTATEIRKRNVFTKLNEMLLEGKSLEERQAMRDRIVERMRAGMEPEKFERWLTVFGPRMNAAYRLEEDDLST